MKPISGYDTSAVCTPSQGKSEKLDRGGPSPYDKQKKQQQEKQSNLLQLTPDLFAIGLEGLGVVSLKEARRCYTSSGSGQTMIGPVYPSPVVPVSSAAALNPADATNLFIRLVSTTYRTSAYAWAKTNLQSVCCECRVVHHEYRRAQGAWG